MDTTKQGRINLEGYMRTNSVRAHDHRLERLIKSAEISIPAYSAKQRTEHTVLYLEASGL